MKSRTWIALLRRIPQELHDSLVLVTSIGTEVSIQGILRVEEEYLVIRGRLAGTTDAGRVFFIPFNDINHLFFQREMKESEIQSLYGQPPATTAAAVASQPTPTDPAAEKATNGD